MKKNIDNGIKKLIEKLSFILSSEQINELTEFVDVGEPLLALESLLDCLVDLECPIPTFCRNDMEDLIQVFEARSPRLRRATDYLDNIQHR